MTDLANATVQAIYDQLVAVLPAAVAVYSAPDENAQAPYVWIAQVAVEDIGGKGDEFERHDLTIQTYVEQPTVQDIHALNAAVKMALKDQSLNSDAAILSAPEFLSSDDVQSEDGAAYVGIVRFALFAQPFD